MRNLKIAVLVLLLGAWSTSAQAFGITFDQQQAGGTIEYDGSGGTLHGIDINIDTINGLDTANPAILSCEDCALNFTTGANIIEGSPLWTFGTIGTFTITGTARWNGIAGPIVASGLLVGGIFTAFPFVPNVVGVGSTLIVNAVGVDKKNPDLLAYFGVPTTTIFTSVFTVISLQSADIGGDGSFVGDVTAANMESSVPVPDHGTTMALLGLGLMGLEALRRKLL